MNQNNKTKFLSAFNINLKIKNKYIFLMIYFMMENLFL